MTPFILIVKRALGGAGKGGGGAEMVVFSGAAAGRSGTRTGCVDAMVSISFPSLGRETNRFASSGVTNADRFHHRNVERVSPGIRLKSNSGRSATGNFGRSPIGRARNRR